MTDNPASILEDERIYSGFLAPSYMPEGGYDVIAGVSGWPRPVRGYIGAGGVGGVGGPPDGQSSVDEPVEDLETEPDYEPAPEDPSVGIPPPGYATTVFPYGYGQVVAMRNARVGPYTLYNPETNEYIKGVSENVSLGGRNPFLLGSYEGSEYVTPMEERWTTDLGLGGDGYFLSEDLDPYIIPLGFGGYEDDLISRGMILPDVQYGYISPMFGLTMGGLGTELITEGYATNPDTRAVIEFGGFRPNADTGFFAEEGSVERENPIGSGRYFTDYAEGWLPGILGFKNGAPTGFGGSIVVDPGNNYATYYQDYWPETPFETGYAKAYLTPEEWLTSDLSEDVRSQYVPYYLGEGPDLSVGLLPIVGGGIVDAGPVTETPYG